MRFRLLLLCLFPFLAEATEQLAERISIDGKSLPMLATPLEDYWSLDHPRPKSLSMLSTGCYRGYYGTWEIRDDYLLLLDLERRENSQTVDGNVVEKRIPLSKTTILGRTTEAPFIAGWFSGVIPIARGFEECRIGGEDQSPDIDYLYINEGRVIRRIAVHNFDGPPYKYIFNRKPEWDGVASGAPTTSLDDDKWVSIDYIYSNFEQVVDRARTLRLRGVYFPGKIWFPPPMTPRASFRLVTDYIRELPDAGSNVEITAEVRTDDRKPYFVVSKIKVLTASEPIRRMPPQQN